MIHSSSNINPNISSVPEIVKAGSLGYVVGPTLESAGPEFAGGVPSLDTTSIPGKLFSLSIIAKGVTDGLDGLAANQIQIEYSDGTIETMINDTTETFSIVRDSDTELAREFTITASGNAYAKIIYTNV
jgi:hypothetical protein